MDACNQHATPTATPTPTATLWQVCSNTACQAKAAMRLVHNRSVFTDKQIVRIQEAPEV